MAKPRCVWCLAVAAFAACATPATQGDGTDATVVADIADVALADATADATTLDAAAEVAAGSDAAPEVDAEVAPPVDAVDAANADVTATDAVDWNCKTSGGNGCACALPADCTSGVCIPGDGDGGKVCSAGCGGGCPSGWGCFASDFGKICAPAFLKLCRPASWLAPCSKDGIDLADWVELTQPNGLDTGGFCASKCLTGTDNTGAPQPPCPAGYTCHTDTSYGPKSALCIPDSGDCTCTAAWAKAGLWTTCYNANAFGECSAARTCVIDPITQKPTLSVCNVGVPSAEVCGDNIDNDCNGGTDENGTPGCTIGYVDSDGDGYGAAEGACSCSSPGKGFSKLNGDCNDLIAAIHPGAKPFCGGIDANCDGSLDVPATSCDDGDPCTQDGCDVITASCGHKAMPSCLSGCKSDSEPSCNDGDPCTDDTCDKATGKCTHAVGLGCACSGTCDDGDVCTADSCDKTTGKCLHAAVAECCNVAVDLCDDQIWCTKDVCDAATNQCQHVVFAAGCACDSVTPCDDVNFCTADDCSPTATPGLNLCVYTAIPGCCNINQECDDGDPCTTDFCDVTINTCKHSAIAGCCKQDADCATIDPCKVGGCNDNQCMFASDGGKPGCCSATTNPNCDDKNICSIDSCSKQMPGGWLQCAHVTDPLNPCCCTASSDCYDGDGCTQDFCINCQCAYLPVKECCASAAECDDKNGCTVDSCPTFQGVGSCVHTPLPLNPLPGACTPALCDDGNPCTADGCSCTGYCDNVPIAGCTLPCDVTNCSVIGNCVMQTCDATGQCIHGNACQDFPCVSPFDCDDGNSCTADICTANGCVFKVLTCDDANPCTLDACLGGTCGHVFVPGCVVPKGP